MQSFVISFQTKTSKHHTQPIQTLKQVHPNKKKIFYFAISIKTKFNQLRLRKTKKRLTTCSPKLCDGINESFVQVLSPTKARFGISSENETRVSLVRVREVGSSSLDVILRHNPIMGVYEPRVHPPSMGEPHQLQRPKIEAFSVKERTEIRDRVSSHLGMGETKKGESFEVGWVAKDDDEDDDE